MSNFHSALKRLWIYQLQLYLRFLTRAFCTSVFTRRFHYPPFPVLVVLHVVSFTRTFHTPVKGFTRLSITRAFSLPFFVPLSYLAPQLPIFPLEFYGEVKRQETIVMGLLCGESCLVLDLNFNRLWLIHPCDGQTGRRTDGRWHIAHYSIYDIYCLAR